MDQDSFVNAIAPKNDLTKIGRAQFGILFRIADTARRGVVSWDEFTVFETMLKRPDADYWMAFQYFDVFVQQISLKCTILITDGFCLNSDHDGYITYDEFKNVFSANIGSEAIPFDFDWYADPFETRMSWLTRPQRLGEVVPRQEERGPCSRLYVQSLAKVPHGS